MHPLAAMRGMPGHACRVDDRGEDGAGVRPPEGRRELRKTGLDGPRGRRVNWTCDSPIAQRIRWGQACIFLRKEIKILALTRQVTGIHANVLTGMVSRCVIKAAMIQPEIEPLVEKYSAIEDPSDLIGSSLRIERVNRALGSISVPSSTFHSGIEFGYPLCEPEDVPLTT